MDEASPDTESRVQPTCSSCRHFDQPRNSDQLRNFCRANPPAQNGDWPFTQEQDWCGQHLSSEPRKDFLDRMLERVEQGVDLAAFAVLRDALASVNIARPAFDPASVLLETASEKDAVQLLELLREVRSTQDETPSDPEAEGG